MKLAALQLQNFKRFRDTGPINFCDPVTGEPKELIVLLGNNGSGKSTVLQAIAALLGTATGRLKNGPSDLDWPGFDWVTINGAWNRQSHIQLHMTFEDTERQATKEYFDRAELPPHYRPPGNNAHVTLDYAPQSPQWVTAQEGADAFFQFKGRQYASMIVDKAVEGFQVYERVGNIFWYHEQRHSLSLSTENGQDALPTMEKLRNQLALWEGFHEKRKNRGWRLRPGQKDIYEELDGMYQKIFPGHRFVGTEPHSAPNKIYDIPPFYLHDGHNEYQLEEMSAGERAIFPILLDFVRLNIHRSIILIDELELHLHPPLQQSLLFNLLRLGTHNQFIITTHSEAVAAIAPDSSVYRVDLWEH